MTVVCVAVDGIKLTETEAKEASESLFEWLTRRKTTMLHDAATQGPIWDGLDALVRPINPLNNTTNDGTTPVTADCDADLFEDFARWFRTSFYPDLHNCVGYRLIDHSLSARLHANLANIATPHTTSTSSRSLDNKTDRKHTSRSRQRVIRPASTSSSSDVHRTAVAANVSYRKDLIDPADLLDVHRISGEEEMEDGYIAPPSSPDHIPSATTSITASSHGTMMPIHTSSIHRSPQSLDGQPGQAEINSSMETSTKTATSTEKQTTGIFSILDSVLLPLQIIHATTTTTTTQEQREHRLSTTSFDGSETSEYSANNQPYDAHIIKKSNNYYSFL